MGNCCSKETLFNNERNINSLELLNNKNVMKYICLTPYDYYLTHDKKNSILTKL